MKKIVIDCRFWGPGHSGLGVYTRQLVSHLAKTNTKVNFSILLRHETIGDPDLPKNFQPIEVEAKAYTIWEQISVAFKLYQLSPDLVHFPSINVPIFYFGKYLVTVHDLIKHESKGTATTTHHPLVYWPKYFIYLFVVWWAVHKSVKILVPSHDVKSRLLAAYRLSSEKIIVTHEAAVLSKAKVVPKPSSLPEKYAIYTGNAYPHKNLSRLIAVWGEVFTKTGVKLVISSGRSVFSAKIEALIAASQGENFVTYKGYLSDKELAVAYHYAQAYVFPTLAEGFGIPGLDAMAAELPVVCSDLPVLREIYGPAAIYFDPKSSQDMIQKITAVLTDAKLRVNLVAAGKIQVKKYSWHDTATKTLATYESCLSL
ncbi:glycosyltransferase family 4 protein [Candidatus Microgenomates bacterium]|nr:glycosyltransferase family 4 protein [Candidatus Microgenomates bacterium]